MEAAVEWEYSPLIRVCNTLLRRWQPTNVPNVNTLLLTKSLLQSIEAQDVYLFHDLSQSVGIGAKEGVAAF